MLRMTVGKRKEILRYAQNDSEAEKRGDTPSTPPVILNGA